MENHDWILKNVDIHKLFGLKKTFIYLHNKDDKECFFINIRNIIETIIFNMYMTEVKTYLDIDNSRVGFKWERNNMPFIYLFIEWNENVNMDDVFMACKDFIYFMSDLARYPRCH